MWRGDALIALAACVAAVSGFYIASVYSPHKKALSTSGLAKEKRMPYVSMDELLFELQPRTLQSSRAPIGQPDPPTEHRPWHDVVAALPHIVATDTDSAYELDAILSHYAKSFERVRLRAVVEGPTSGPPLRAPLTGKACVLYHAVATREGPGGRSVLIASDSRHCDFYVALQAGSRDGVGIGGYRIRIKVLGDEVTLFGTVGGVMTTTKMEDDMPEAWKKFVSECGGWHREHIKVDGGSEGLHEEPQALHFDESSLPIGSEISIVGKLVKRMTGALHLRKLDAPGTSECPGRDYDEWPLKSTNVLITDDPQRLS